MKKIIAKLAPDEVYIHGTAVVNRGADPFYIAA